MLKLLNMECVKFYERKGILKLFLQSRIKVVRFADLEVSFASFLSILN